ncbi:type IV pilin protein [Chondromyces crocatus]|uniref:Type II secretion pathway pseudopilin n=1 Tax=Chondromyces crocatus TaxID=52 RepID=A0A0K1EP36_CHOCO|nr:prepilin-type N-terminal cleavage/methylation domain-containing protein [Chondromyces crocatus]AKT42569.1 type II secretion pathway pseudopilin [Chondromyces crocatus]
MKPSTRSNDLPSSLPRRSRRAARRGFSLVEIGITVALVGVLAAIGTQRVYSYFASARTAEAKHMIGGIARALTTTFAVKNYVNIGAVNALGPDPGLCRDTTSVPAAMGSVQRRKYQPSGQAGRDYNTGNTLGGWKCVGFSNEQAQHYQYRYNMGAPPVNVGGNGPPPSPPGVPLSRQFAISAKGDVDGDNKFSWFIITGYAMGHDLTISPGIGIQDAEE